MRLSNLAEPARFVAQHESALSQLTADSATSLAISGRVTSSTPSSLVVTLSDNHGAEGQELLLEAVEDGIVRIRLGLVGATHTRSNEAWKLLRTQPEPRAEVRVEAGTATLSTSSLSVELTLSPIMIKITDASGRTILETLQNDVDATDTKRSLPIGMTAGSTSVINHMSFRVHADDQFYGLGESFTPINKRGSRATMWTCDAYGTGSDRMYKPVPYLYSTAGYALIVDTGLALELDIAATSTGALSLVCPDEVLDCYIVAGPSAAEALQRSRHLTGDLVCPPRWAFGGWMSTGFLPQTQESVLARAHELQVHDFPCDVIHIDPYWMKPGTWCDLEWDSETFPDPVSMLAQLRDLGIHTCLWINPYISDQAPCFAEASAAGYFLRTKDGRTWTGQIWGDDFPHPPVAIIDFTNAAARSWYADRLRSRLREGVSLFKTDFGEAIPTTVYTADGLDGAALHNVYPLLYNELVSDVTEEVTGNRVVWGRSSYLGGQRHVAQWGGDTATTWEGMASTLRGGLSYSMSGYSFWSHDVGGFSGRPTPELFRAWGAWGALSPLTRLHGTTSRIPWEWDDTTQESLARSMRVRYELMPHIYSLALQSVRTGLPMTRPAPLFCPDDPGARTADSCYLLGDDIVVAPARDEDGTQLAYLPRGEWINYSTGERHEGGKWVTGTIRDEIPAFVRVGAMLPTTSGLRRVPDGPFQNVILQVWAPEVREVMIEDVNGATRVATEVAAGVLNLTADGPLDLAGVELRDAPGVRSVRYRGADYPVDGGTPDGAGIALARFR